jgi:hypothetical protein
MWNYIEANPFVVGALTGSLAAYLLGLLVSYFRREKRWLGYSVGSRNIVQGGHSKLAIQYDGREIVRLDSHQIDVRNIGNRPLTNLPVRIESRGGGEIVEHELTCPDGSSFSVSPDGLSCLVVTIDLLNPGEIFSVGLTVADATTSDVRVIARAELLEVREIGTRLNTEDLLEILMPSIPLGSVTLDLYRLSHRKNRR